MSRTELRVASLNISGGEKTFEEFSHDTQVSRKKALEMLVDRLDASVLCLQEVSQYIDADGVTSSLLDVISQAGNYDYHFYGKTVSMETHLQVKKDIMVQGIFNDWWDWSKGNAILARIPFARLGDLTRPGVPRNIPLYQPDTYEGTRDTEPRHTLLARLKEAPFPYVATLHLSTLLGERTIKSLPYKIEQSHLMRYQQIRRFLDLVQANILQKEEILILAGDFNATEDEFCISHLLKSNPGFIRLEPENDVPSHPYLEKAIDHIFFFPQERLIDYTCRIDTSELSRRASDHLPVIADLQIE